MKLRVFSAALWAITILAAAPQAHAQQQYPLVKDIEVQYVGPKTIAKEKILSNMQTHVGRPYNPNWVKNDINSIMGIGDVLNVRIFGNPKGDGVEVIVVLETKSTISEVVITGNVRIKTPKIRDQIKSKPGDALSPSNLNADKQKIIEYYQGKNYGDVDVNVRTESNEKTGSTRVIFEVIEGSRSKIDHVDFQGNTALGRKELLKVIKTKPKGILNIFSSTAGKLNSDQIEEDRDAIRAAYQSHGYIEADVREPNLVRRGQKVDVTFPIVEGRQYHVGKVSYSGARVFPLDELTRGLKLQAGSIYSPQALASDVQALRTLYGSKGYIELNVVPSTSSGGSGVMNVDFRLDEGIQYYVDKVNISGNGITHDKVIRRESALAPGDIFDITRANATRQRLEGLRYFKRVDVRPAEPLISLPGRRDMDIDVEETRTGSFNFGAGFSSVDNLLGFVELTQGNFDVTDWPHFRGGGEKFRMRMQYGTRRKDFVLSLTEPYFLDQKLSLGGEIYYRDASYQSSVYDERRYGFATYLRKPINEFTAGRFEYRLENVGLHNFDDGVSETIRSEAGDKLKSQISLGITNDTRDINSGTGNERRMLLPRRGHRIDAQVYLAGGFLGGDTQIYGLDIQATQYFLLPGDTILSFEGQIAGVDTWGSGDRVPIFDRLYLGGPNSLRGFTYRDVGPKDENGEPIGGQSMARFTAEYTFPIVETVRGAVFYDVGFVNAGAWDFGGGNINSDVGIGLMLEIPGVGPIRVDYGIPIQSDRFNDSSGRFQFNVGYRF